MKQSIKKTIIASLIIIALFSVTSIIFSILKSLFVLYLGIRVYNILKAVFIIATIVVSVIAVANIIRIAISKRQKEINANITITLENINNQDIKSRVTERMIRLMKPINSLKYAFDEFTRDCASIDTKRKKIDKLSEQNNISLSNVKDVLATSEITIYTNIQKALNCVALWDTDEEHDQAFADIYAERHAYIDSVIKINDRICVNCDKLLSESVKYINAKNDDLSDNNSDIESMSEALQTLRKMNETVDDFNLK